MKKLLSLLLILLFSITVFGCSTRGNSNDTDGGSGPIIVEVKQFYVYFVIDGETKYYKIVTNMQIFSAPDIPEKENYTIVGWVNADGELHDFSKPLKTTTTLYAKYEADYKALTNIISTKIISANVKIEVEVYNLGGWFNSEKKNVLTWRGSGIVFHDQHGKYYVLTNEHVTNMQTRKYAKYTVIDFKGNKYTANRMDNTEQASYDLSVLYFEKTTQVLNVIDIATKNPIRNQEVVAIGQPEGQNNTITFGKINDYQKITLTNGFSPSFNVIRHDAPTAPGSSGGALLDLDFNLVGINFAGSQTSNGEFINGYSIPAETIMKYLVDYVYVKQ